MSRLGVNASAGSGLNVSSFLFWPMNQLPDSECRYWVTIGWSCHHKTSNGRFRECGHTFGRWVLCIILFVVPCVTGLPAGYIAE